ncbi:MAG: serine/threonine protein kinase [Planctomycetales bacterium]|nr:serine/threonine protein kinase [Planctomycetales bacterium]
MGLFDRFKTMLDGKLNVEARFEILREAVSGTMSAFYMARDKKTDEVVGLKILDVDKTAHFESRFKGLEKPTEGEIGELFDHPLIVKTLEHGVTNHGEHYVIMEFIDGPGMNSLIIERSPLLDGNRVRLIRQMALAIGVVHDAGYIHRDICPRNFICSKDCKSLKLIDFGLTVPATKEFMQPGNRTGTPNYMAPEIVRRRPTDQRIDIFSLGVTCYQLCALQLPWPGQDVTGKAAMLHDTKEPVPLLQAKPDVNPDLAALIMQCVEKDPAKRPKSIKDFLRVLDRINSETV